MWPSQNARGKDGGIPFIQEPYRAIGEAFDCQWSHSEYEGWKLLSYQGHIMTVLLANVFISYSISTTLGSVEHLLRGPSAFPPSSHVSCSLKV